LNKADRQRRVLSVSSGRADIGILAPVWEAISNCSDLDLHVALTGMHMAADATATPVFPANATVHRGGRDIGGRGGAEAAAAMAEIQVFAGNLIDRLVPDMLFVVGDRLDMIPFAIAGLPFNVPIIHLHGGEITEGAIDDRIRHAISKLSHLHCVSSQSARERLLAMGEPAERIVVTGAPGIDSLIKTRIIARDEFLHSLAIPDTGRFRLSTIHPETNATDPLAPVNAILPALASHPAPTLFTAPNSDPAGAAVRTRICEFVEANDWAFFVDTLGSKLYANALRHASCMVGNSSSGIIEAGVFGLPVINVGDRQKGRQRGSNVIDVPNQTLAVAAAMNCIENAGDRFPTSSIYGDGKAASRIAELLRALPDRQLLVDKRPPLALRPVPADCA
jgi:UDP-hydrolysing UDP-N-acetyl-D-glucosamine 2-epimerase